MIRLGGIGFYSNNYQLIHHHPDLIELTAFVWVLFKDQKNRLKFDTHTPMETRDPLLCLVIRLGRTIQHVLRFVKNYNENTPLCIFH